MFISESCEANVALVAVVNNDMLVLAVFIKPSCDVKVELIFDTEVFKELIFKVSLTTSAFKEVRTASFVVTFVFSAASPVTFVLIYHKWVVNVAFVFAITVLSALCVAIDIGLFKSDVLSTLPNPI